MTGGGGGDRSWLQHGPAHSNGPVLDDDILADPDINSCIENASKVLKACLVSREECNPVVSGFFGRPPRITYEKRLRND